MFDRKDYRLYWVKENRASKHTCHGCALFDINCKAVLSPDRFKCVCHKNGKAKFGIFKLIKKVG